MSEIENAVQPTADSAKVRGTARDKMQSRLQNAARCTNVRTATTDGDRSGFASSSGLCRLSCFRATPLLVIVSQDPGGRMDEFFTTEQAAAHALSWCSKNPKWKRICDIPDSDSLYKTWEELPKKVRDSWTARYGYDAESAWLEFGTRPCKVKYGYISGKGEFFRNILHVPRFHNVMMVFRVG